MLSASEGLTLQALRERVGERRGGDSHSTHIKLRKNSADTPYFTPGSVAPIVGGNQLTHTDTDIDTDRITHAHTHTHAQTHTTQTCWD